MHHVQCRNSQGLRLLLLRILLQRDLPEKLAASQASLQVVHIIRRLEAQSSSLPHPAVRHRCRYAETSLGQNQAILGNDGSTP